MVTSTTLETEERNKAIVLGMYERLHRGELAVLDDHPGMAETKVYFPLAFAAFPDLAARVEQVIAEGDKVVVHIWLTGTHTGPLAGIPPTGKAVEFQLIAIDRLEDGRVVQHNSEEGWMNVMMQLGVLPFRDETR